MHTTKQSTFSAVRVHATKRDEHKFERVEDIVNISIYFGRTCARARLTSQLRILYERTMRDTLQMRWIDYRALIFTKWTLDSQYIEL